MEIIRIRLTDLEQNKGQVAGLPSNPRQWGRGELDNLVKSIQETPELLEARGLIVWPYGGKYIILGGNMRFSALREMNAVDAPCYVLPEDTPMEKLREIVIKDNGAFGSWDYDMLANEWDDLPLSDWGVPAWSTEDIDLSEVQEGGVEGVLDAEQKSKEKDEMVEGLLNDAMRENVREAVAQIEHTMQKGWVASFLTKGLAQAKFIRAKFYREHYPQWMSLYFCPQRMWTSANGCSPMEQIEKIAKGETDAGIAGLRTMTGDHLLLLLKGSYPFGGARMPMDFPANTARALIEEFGGGKGCKVLDPCHGWGGRLCGAMMADVGLYVGVDPSHEAHAGLIREYEAFAQYCEDTQAEFLLSPFEDVDLEGRVFDMALTSPPYFDVEQYHGELQAHERYNNYPLWVDGFYRPMIEKVYAHIKPGGVFCLQVGSQSYPLAKDGVKIALQVGFTVEDIRPLGGATSSSLHNNTDDDEENEKIIILRK